MNIPLLRRIQRQIDKAPERFVMATAYKETECGTAFCIGGWAKALSCALLSDIKQYALGGKIDAYDLLDIDLPQGERLFFIHLWPRKFQAKDGSTLLPAFAIKRIQHFIATNGEE